MGKKILVVARQLGVANRVISQLGEDNVQEVSVLTTPTAGIKAAQKGTYDLIILGDDPARGNSSNLDVAYAVRSSMRNKRTPVISCAWNRDLAARVERATLPLSFRIDPRNEADLVNKLDIWVQKWRDS